MGLTDRLAALHAAVLRGDADAREIVCQRLVADLRRRLSAAYPLANADIVESSTHDAVLTYLRDPGRYRPECGDLIAWLFIIGKRRIQTLLRTARRRSKREATGGLRPLGASDVPDEGNSEHEQADWLMRRRLQLLGACWEDAERRFVLARLAGASRAVRARALGVVNPDSRKARTEMNKVWERIMMRLRRR